jgi:hypothetical protein
MQGVFLKMDVPEESTDVCLLCRISHVAYS